MISRVCVIVWLNGEGVASGAMVRRHPGIRLTMVVKEDEQQEGQEGVGEGRRRLSRRNRSRLLNVFIQPPIAGSD